MSGRARLTICAYAATLMAAGAMLPLLDSPGWLIQAAVLLAAQCGAGALARRVPLPRPLTVAVQAFTGLVLLTLAFARDHAILGVLPGPQTLARFGEMLATGGQDIERYAIPAPASDGIRLMVIGGVLAIGLLVDTLAVTFRSAAPAGLPLLALYSVAAGLAGGAASALWFVLAASGYLLLLLAEGRDRLSAWGRVFGGGPGATARGARAFEPSGRMPRAPVRSGRRIGVLALGVALAVPAALPALDGGLLDGTAAGKGSGSGGGDTISAVNPLVSLQDSLKQPQDREVLRYRTGAQDTQDLYLRIVSLDQFDGTAWKTSERKVRDVPDRLPQPAGLSPSVATDEITTNITAAGSYRQNWLPLPYPATEVRIGGRWRYEPEGRNLVGDQGQTTRGAEYTVSSLMVKPTAEQLAGAPAPPADIVREYTEVPDSLPDTVEETARRVTAGTKNQYEAAVRLQDWFTTDGGFAYDVNVDSGTGAAAITRFLQRKEGFCVHFSFSMAAMARTLGIPARVAVGFTPGTAQANGIMSVGIRDAHAWPELYFEGVGWTRFEPTPSRGSTPEYTREDSPAGAPSDPEVPEATASDEPSATPSASDSCPPDLRRRGECSNAAPVEEDTPTDSGASGGNILLIALGVPVALALPLLPMLWRIRVRARRLGSGGRGPAEVTARTLATWLEVSDTAWDHGIPPDESLTARKAAARIVRLGRLEGEAADSVHRVASAVEQVLYAPEPRPATGLVDDAERIRAGLRAGVSRWTRLRAHLLPRSAVRVIWAASARWTAFTDRWSARFRAWGPSRRPGWARLRPPSKQRG
ncbi:DUF3488 and DUF4129 domain-containing transglutaminase family protein [Streptomyces sp. NPDC051018]|uniref:DUF3488 and DUF4129 domain-containing transglutaminase family protein n=1 Tax=Streptomyces sp. NPDC051018 TaxID=3365639 RepID=UPI0037A929F5